MSTTRKLAALGLLIALSGSLVAIDAPAGDPVDLAYSFRLESSTGASLGSWSKVDGLSVKFEVVEYGGKHDLMLRAATGSPQLVLTAGDVAGSMLEEWWKEQSASGKPAKRTITLGLMDHVSGQKGTGRRRCGFTLGDTKLQSFAKRTAVREGKKVEVVDLTLVPSKVSDSCAELFKPPADRKKK